MTEPLTCISCSSKLCNKTEVGAFDICKYGIAFFNSGDSIKKREPQVQLSNISRNLRHELNPILQTIVEQTTKLDNTLSVRLINLDNPLSIIIGSTVILDNFIQMITGVHEFHTSPTSISHRKIKLKDIVNYYYLVYAILKEEERAKNIKLNNLIPENYYISFCSDFIKYIIAVLVDNAWKYSLDNSTLTVNANTISENKCKIIFTNQSKTIDNNLNIFDLGIKVDENSKGFGYGLYWAKLLEFNYNVINQSIENKGENFSVQHKQINSASSDIAYQEFSLNNLLIEKE